VITQKVKEIAAEQFGLKVEDVANESTFESMGADSLDAVEFVMALEEEFDIEIEEDAVENLDTISGYIDLVQNLKTA
jgi:acyl carrier protein